MVTAASVDQEAADQLPDAIKEITENICLNRILMQTEFPTLEKNPTEDTY